MPANGRFLAFEGLDGSGKSTLIKGLELELKAQGLDYVLSREPGGTELGAEIRQMLLRVKGDIPVPRSEVLLYQADRAQHVEKLIKPGLAAGKWVISDRYAASTYAFQSAGRAIPIEDIKWLNRFATDELFPDMYVLLDLTIEESRRRLNGRGANVDRFELEGRDFHQKVRDGYLQQVNSEPERWFVLNATEKPGVLVEKLLAKLKEKKWLP